MWYSSRSLITQKISFLMNFFFGVISCKTADMNEKIGTSLVSSVYMYNVFLNQTLRPFYTICTSLNSYYKYCILEKTFKNVFRYKFLCKTWDPYSGQRLWTSFYLHYIQEFCLFWPRASWDPTTSSFKLPPPLFFKKRVWPSRGKTWISLTLVILIDGLW